MIFAAARATAIEFAFVCEDTGAYGVLGLSCCDG